MLGKFLGLPIAQLLGVALIYAGTSKTLTMCPPEINNPENSSRLLWVKPVLGENSGENSYVSDNYLKYCYLM